MCVCVCVCVWSNKTDSSLPSSLPLLPPTLFLTSHFSLAPSHSPPHPLPLSPHSLPLSPSPSPTLPLLPPTLSLTPSNSPPHSLPLSSSQHTWLDFFNNNSGDRIPAGVCIIHKPSKQRTFFHQELNAVHPSSEVSAAGLSTNSCDSFLA